VIFLLKDRKRIPGILIAVVGATAIVRALDLAARADVPVLGPLPRGLPTFAIPWITYADIVPVLIGGSGFHTHLGRSPQLSRRAASGHDGLKAFRRRFRSTSTRRRQPIRCR
jgi:hypothetical protein